MPDVTQKMVDAEAWWKGLLCSKLKNFGLTDHTYCKMPLTNHGQMSILGRSSILKTERDKNHELRVALEQSNALNQQLEEELRNAAVRLRDLELELRQETIQSTKLESEREDHHLRMHLAKQSVRLYQVATFIAFVVFAVSLSAYVNLRKELRTAKSESNDNKGRLHELQAEFDSELSGAIKLGQLPNFVDPDYEISEDSTLRCVKIACPIACRSDIDIEVICNGCIVTVNQPGADDIPWTKKIQFKPSDGLCEFKGLTLDGEFIKLEFQRSRVHRFKSLSLIDAEDDIDPSGSDTVSDDLWIQPETPS